MYVCVCVCVRGVSYSIICTVFITEASMCLSVCLCVSQSLTYWGSYRGHLGSILGLIVEVPVTCKSLVSSRKLFTLQNDVSAFIRIKHCPNQCFGKK